MYWGHRIFASLFCAAIIRSLAGGAKRVESEYNRTSNTKLTNQHDPKTAKTLKNILNSLSRTFSLEQKHANVNGAISKYAKEIARKTLDQSMTRPVRHFFSIQANFGPWFMR